MKARVCQTEIATVVGVHKFTISREIRRNRGLRILKECGTEYCGKADRHDCQLYLAINDINKIQSILVQIRYELPNIIIMNAHIRVRCAEEEYRLKHLKTEKVFGRKNL